MLKKSSSEKAGGLVRTLYLCKSAMVVLTCNLNVPFGLFNGSMGKVVDIIYCSGKTSHSTIPDIVMVEFSKYTGPPFISENPKVVPIVAVTRKLECNCYACKRTQIPLRLGWGTTIHRCQGMTIGCGESNRYIVINPGTKKFESRNPGALFVALSRAKNAGNEIQDPDFAWHPSILINEDRICHVVKTPTTKARDSEIKRIQDVTEQTQENFKHLDSENCLINIMNQII